MGFQSSKSILGIFIVLITFVNLSFAQDNFINKHMKEYSNDENFTSINFSLSGQMAKGMIEEMKSEMGEMGDQFMGLIKNLSSLNVLTTEKDAQKHYEKALAIMKKEKYQPLMTVKEGKSTGVNIMAKEGSNGIEEVLVLVNDDDDFVLVCFSGK